MYLDSRPHHVFDGTRRMFARGHNQLDE